jgi:hypothetical protein
MSRTARLAPWQRADSIAVLTYSFELQVYRAAMATPLALLSGFKNRILATFTARCFVFNCSNSPIASMLYPKHSDRTDQNLSLCSISCFWINQRLCGIPSDNSIHNFSCSHCSCEMQVYRTSAWTSIPGEINCLRPLLALPMHPPINRPTSERCRVLMTLSSWAAAI